VNSDLRSPIFASEVGVSLSRSLHHVTLDATVGLRDSGGAPREARMFVNALWRLSRDRGTVRASSRGGSHGGLANEVRYRTAGGSQPRDIVASLAVQQAPDVYGADVSLAYTDERFVAATSAAASTDHGGAVQPPRADVELGTAIAFAGGRVAWSRPITGSFVIVDRNTQVANQFIGVNPNGSAYAARADRLGPAVISGLEPYRVGTLRIEAPDLPLGMSLGADRYAVLPTYQSGTRISVGEPGTVYMRGTAVHADGTPVAFAVGELVVSTTNETRFDCASATVHWQDRIDCLTEMPRPNTPRAPRSWTVMTNGAGRFAVSGVAPGRYHLKLPGSRPAMVMIPARYSGVFSTGTLRVD
jgi:outer membrane usher protein